MADILKELDQMKSGKASLNHQIEELKRENQRLQAERKLQAGINEVEINISVIPTQILRYSPEAAPTP